MSNSSTYTALNVPTIPPYPSPTCLQWTADGQICFVTKSAVYMLTPDPGINFDVGSIITAPAEREKQGLKSLGWFRTMVQFVKGEAFNWPEKCQNFGAISLGSLDMTLLAVATSPSGITIDAGCVLAILTTNMDLTLWSASKNHLKGEWFMMQYITPSLMKPDKVIPETQRTQSAQTVCVTWTSQANFGISPMPTCDGSFLVIGTRAGSLRFLRFNGVETAEIMHTLSVSEKWVTQLACTECRNSGPAESTALIAWAGGDGAVGAVQITQTLDSLPDAPVFVAEHTIRTSFAPNTNIWEPDQRAISALKWVEIVGRSPILVHCKPGVVYLWAPSSDMGWVGQISFPLRSQNICVDSSPFHPVSGIEYIPRRDVLILTLLDGSFHTIHNLRMAPSLDPLENSEGFPLTDRYLSLTSRAIFAQTESAPLTRDDANRISGMISYDRSSTVIWVHEACRPSDFSYKHDSKHACMLVTASMWPNHDDDDILDDLSHALNSARASSGHVPLSLLRSTFFHLRITQNLTQIHARVLEILLPPPAAQDDHSLLVEVLPFNGTLDSLDNEVQARFKRSLARHLFGWDILLSLRMRLSLADFCWKLSDDSQMQGECGHVAQHLLTTISHRVLRTILRHLSAIVPLLTQNDIPFVVRIIVQCLLPGSPEDLCVEAQTLADQIKPAGDAPPHDLNELCPACNVKVELQDITSGTCVNGHTWARCSITSFLLATPFVRTCIGCSRKAFLASSSGSRQEPMSDQWLPVEARGWVVQALLEAVHRCLFCGNAFVSVL